MESRDAQNGKKGEMRGRASVKVVPKCAILSKSMPGAGFTHCGLFVQLKIVQDVSRDRADY